MQKLTALFCRHKDIFLYFTFGVFTTIVNYLVYLPCLNLLGISAALSNCIAWIVAVAFAFLTNKPIVFRSHDWTPKTVLPELGKFVSCRIATGLMETAALFALVDTMHFDGNILKIVTSIAVIILNYVGSKIFVFRKDSLCEKD